MALLLAGLGMARAAAVQPVYRVDAEVLFLPLNGLALHAHTGRVLWRLPRFEGTTYTDGHGLLLVSWADLVQPQFRYRRFTRICRIRTSDGAKEWCRDWGDVQQWSVDNGGAYLYLHVPGRLEVIATATGQPDRGFKVQDDGAISLLPLPEGGVLALDRGQRERGQIEAYAYRPGAAALSAERLPATVYPFRGNGRGLLFYTREKGEFFLAAPFTALFHRLRPPRQFPKATLDQHGFVFTDWEGERPIVRGGTYGGTVWQAPRDEGEPDFALAPETAVMLENDNGATRIEGWSLASGVSRYRQRLEGGFDTVAARDGAVVLQANDSIRLLEAANGALRWEVKAHEGPLAAIAQSSVVFWEASNVLVGRARNNGAVLWRVRFEEPRLGAGTN